MTAEQVAAWMKTSTCPVCGKTFVPAPLHAYRDKRANTNKLVCSYACMRKSERMKEYANKRKRPHRSCGVVRCIDTGEVYSSANAAYFATGAYCGSILAVCRGTMKTAGGFRWEFVEEVMG